MDIHPYSIAIPQTLLDDLSERLQRTRWPDEVSGVDWTYGIPRAYLQSMVTYWQTTYDWRKQEQKINQFAQYYATVDNVGIHFIHERGVGPRPLPLLLTHGWPSTFFEWHRLIPLLTQPAAHGGSADDAFDVIVPSVPGHGFSQQPTFAGFHDYTVARLWIHLMEGLGYQQFGLHAYDLGASISGLLCLHHPEVVIGYHTTSPANPGPILTAHDILTSEEQAYRDELKRWWAEEGGYAHLQETRPQTLAYGLNDSPVGLAAWILEKWYMWTLPPSGDLSRHFSEDDLLTTIMIYWVTQTINAANRYYKEGPSIPWPKAGDHVRVPLGVALNGTQRFEHPPRSYVERLYPDIRQWVELGKGGHFVGLEEPELVATAIRSFFRPLRK